MNLITASVISLSLLYLTAAVDPFGIIHAPLCATSAC